MHCPDPETVDILDLRRIETGTGCMIVARPDQPCMQVLPLHGAQSSGTGTRRGDGNNARAPGQSVISKFVAT